jgi:hypothetical protein
MNDNTPTGDKKNVRCMTRFDHQNILALSEKNLFNYWVNFSIYSTRNKLSKICIILNPHERRILDSSLGLMDRKSLVIYLTFFVSFF